MTKFFTKISNNNNHMSSEDLYLPQKDQTTDNQLPLEINPDEEWIDKENIEGQLTVDVFQTKDNLIVKSTIAGVKPEDIDVAIDNDMITIRGTRKYDEEVKEEDYFYQECYWGDFSRSIVLPMEVEADKSEASLKNGVLTITLPKAQKSKSVAVKVTEE